MGGFGWWSLITFAIGIILVGADFVIPERIKKRIGWVLLFVGVPCLLFGVVGLGRNAYVKWSKPNLTTAIPLPTASSQNQAPPPPSPPGRTPNAATVENKNQTPSSPPRTEVRKRPQSGRPSEPPKQNDSTAIGRVMFSGSSIPPGSVFSIGQQGGITAGTVNNFGPPRLPTPTVKVCVDYPAVAAGEDYGSVITLTTSSQLPRPWFALFFDGPVLDGSVERTMGAYGYTHTRADKLPNPERTFAFRTLGMGLGGPSTWFPGDGPIRVTVPSKGRVKLIRVLSGGGDDPDSVFNVNLVYSCD